VPPQTLTGSVRGDLVFIEALIGIGEVAISDHRSSQPTLDELMRLASDAHVAGLMTGKAGVLHLHLGDGLRGLDLVRQALEKSELPPRVFHPTHVNRRKGLFDEALALTAHGCTIDLTAFPVEEGEDAWSAADALLRYLDSDAPAERITVSSDAGGCLPTFDADGHVCRMGVGESGALLETLNEVVARGCCGWCRRGASASVRMPIWWRWTMRALRTMSSLAAWCMCATDTSNTTARSRIRRHNGTTCVVALSAGRNHAP